LLDLIPLIENTLVFGEWKGGEKNQDGAITMPWCMSAPIVAEFLDTVYAIPIGISFNWPEWDEGREIARTDFDFDTVNLVTKCKLITAIVRNDRFCEGALISAFESGLILKILKSIEKELGASRKYNCT
jgi:hypothetical protein